MEFLKRLLRKVNPQWVTYIVTVIVSAIVGALFQWLGMPVPPEPIKPNVPIFVSPGADEADVEAAEQSVRDRGGIPETYRTGWIDDPDAVAIISAGLPNKFFYATPAGAADDPLPSSVFLWQAYTQLMARPPPCKNQNPIGSCVSFGTNTAIERTMAVEITVLKHPWQFKHLAEEVTYAGSRVEIGGGRIGGDGSVGAWAAKFVNQWGVVPREQVGNHDLSKYDPSRCRAWGRSGVPNDIEPLAREHPVQDVTQVKTWAEAKRAMANGFGIAICSNQGFSMKRDANGVCRPSGSWAHCMALDGYYIDSAGVEYGHIENSWGENAHTGPVGWGNPTSAGFWCESKTIERMLKQGDSWAFSAVKGFPRRKNVIDWFAYNDAKHQADRFLATQKPREKLERFAFATNDLLRR